MSGSGRERRAWASVRLPAYSGLVACALLPVLSAGAQGQSCTRDDFALVVEQASKALQTLNTTNTTQFQEKLRALRSRHKWTHEQFLQEAAAYVRDEQILAYDEETSSLLNKIEGLGDGGSSRQPDCSLLEVLRGHMHALVQTTQAKWTYMFAKIDKALWAPAGR